MISSSSARPHPPCEPVYKESLQVVPAPEIDPRLLYASTTTHIQTTATKSGKQGEKEEEKSMIVRIICM